MKAAIIYHYFAHYRRPVLDALNSIERSSYEFIAGASGPKSRGIDLCSDLQPFSEAKCYFLPFGFMVQTGLIRHCLRSDLDVIIFLGDWKWPSTWVAALVARLAGKRVLFWTHGWRTLGRGPVSILRKLFYKIPHGLLLYGNRARLFAIDEGFSAHRLYVVYNSMKLGIDDSFDKPSSEAGSAALRIICSARLVKLRRLDLLMEALRNLSAREVSAETVIIGDGPMMSELKAMVKEYRLDVTFVGACYEMKEIEDRMSEAHVTVCPGALGLTAIQSMFYGVPVITTDDFSIHGPEAEAVVQGYTGAFFEDGDADRLADALVWFHQLPCDERRTMSIACRKVVRHLYTPDKQAGLIDAAVWGESPTELSVDRLLLGEEQCLDTGG